MYKKSILIFAILLALACQKHTPKNELVFSCIHCKGCVIRQLKFIKKEKLDQQFQVVLDSNCIGKVFPLENIHFQHLDQKAIFQQYGRFGNLLYFDTTGNRVEFLTDMNLEDYIVIE